MHFVIFGYTSKLVWSHLVLNYQIMIQTYILAKTYGIYFIVVGLGLIIGPDRFREWYESLLQESRRVLFGGTISLVGQFPKGEFKDQGVPDGLGVDFTGKWHPVKELAIGINLGGSRYGVQYRNPQLSLTLPGVTVEEEISNNILWLPSSTNLSREDAEYVSSAVNNFLGN